MVNIKKLKIFIIALLIIQFVPPGIINEKKIIEAASTKLIYKTDFEADSYNSPYTIAIDDPIKMFDDSLTTYEPSTLEGKVKMILNQAQDIDKIIYKSFEPSTIDFFDASGTKIGSLDAPSGTQTLNFDYKYVKEVVFNGVNDLWIYNFEMYGITSTGTPPSLSKLIYKTDFESDIYDAGGAVKISDPISLFDESLTNYETIALGSKARMFLNEVQDVGRIAYKIDEPSTIDFYDVNGTKIGASLNAPSGSQFITVDYKNVKEVVFNGAGQLWMFNFEIYSIVTVPPPPPPAPAGKLIYKTDFIARIWDVELRYSKNDDPMYVFDDDTTNTYEDVAVGDNLEVTLNNARDLDEIVYNIDDFSSIDFLNGNGTKIGATLSAPAGEHTFTIDYKNVKKVVFKGAGQMWIHNFELHAAETVVVEPTPVEPIAESDTPLPVIDKWNQIKDFSSSLFHNLVVTENGNLYAWGSNNSYGELGDGTTIVSKTPKLIPLLKNVKTVSAGYNYSLAQTEDGKVWSWGTNLSKQLGRVATDNSVGAMTPGEIPEAMGATHIRANRYSNSTIGSSAFIKNGDLYTVGSGEYGKLGNGTTIAKTTFSVTNVKTQTASSFIKFVDFGLNHTIIQNDKNEVWGFGRNNLYQLTIPNSTVNPKGPVLQSLVPVRIKNTNTVNLPTMDEVYVGENHVLTRKGAYVYTWGGSSNGQVGGSTTTKMLATSFSSITTAKGISAVDKSSYASTTDGKISGWGWNNIGQLGVTTPTQSLTPVIVETAPGVPLILNNIIKMEGSSALTSDKKLWKWGVVPGDGTDYQKKALQVNLGINKVLGMTVVKGPISNGKIPITVTLEDVHKNPIVKFSQEPHLRSYFRPVVQGGENLGTSVIDADGDLIYQFEVSKGGTYSIYAKDDTDKELRQDITIDLGISAPTILTPITRNFIANETIDLNWGGSSNSEGGVINYEVSLTTDNGVTWKMIKNFGTETTGSYTFLPSDTTNNAKFRVRAKNDVGDLSNYLEGNLFVIEGYNLFKTFGNINFGQINLSGSKTIKAISTEEESLNFTQYTSTPQGYTINITFSPFSSSTGNTISSSNLKIKKMTLQTDTGDQISGEFSFQDNISKQLMNIDTLNANKTNSYKILPEDIELTIPTDFVPISNGSEEFISTITYSVVIVP